MPQFEYQGFTASGKNAKGTIVSDNIASAKSDLKEKGIYPSSIRESNVQPGVGGNAKSGGVSRLFSRVKSGDIAMMTRQLATLVGANIPLIEALNALVDQVENPQLQGAISKIKQEVNEGRPLNKALAGYPEIFSNLYVSMVESGEASGTLDIVLLRLADFLEYQDRLKKRIVGAMIYPVLMLVVAMGALFVIFTTVIPEIAVVFEQNKQALPMLTQIVLAISNIVVEWWWAILLGLVLIAVAIQRWLGSSRGKRWWDETRLKLPIFGEMTRMLAVSRFTKTLSTLLKSGITLLTSLGVVKNVVGNITIQEAIEKATTDLTEGATIAAPLRKSGQFPPMVTHMITVGEKTGELEAMLEKVSEHYEYQVDTRVQTLTSLLEPFMIITLAGIVMVIVLSVILPMLEMNNAAL